MFKARLRYTQLSYVSYLQKYNWIDRKLEEAEENKKELGILTISSKEQAILSLFDEVQSYTVLKFLMA